MCNHIFLKKHHFNDYFIDLVMIRQNSQSSLIHLQKLFLSIKNYLKNDRII